MTSPNDWNIKTFSITCISIISADWLSVALHLNGINIPVIHQLLGFVLLSLVPGYIILRILKIHNINVLESLLYASGISIIYVYVVGSLANFILPLLGIVSPISLIPILLSFTSLILPLLFLGYYIDKDFIINKPITPATCERTINKPWRILNPWLLCLLLPLFSILGTLLINHYQINGLIFTLLFIICIIIILAALRKFFTPTSYAFVLFFTSLSLLYQTTLLSTSLVGSDVHLEYGVSKAVIDNGYWEYSLPISINSCLAIVLFTPVYSLVLNMSSIWIIKLIYPIVFSLLPLAIFRAYRIQTNPYFAFIAALFFITTPMFFMDMPQLARQQIAELFFGLVILLMLDRRLNMVCRTILATLFSIGVIASHYGLGTGYIGYILSSLAILLIIRSKIGRNAWQFIIGKNKLLPDLKLPPAFNIKSSLILIVVSAVFIIVYYSSIASGVAMGGLQLIAYTANNIFHNLTNLSSSTITPLPADNHSVLNAIITTVSPIEPLTNTAIGLDFFTSSTGGQVWRVFQYLVEICLIIGSLLLFFNPTVLGEKLRAEYLALTGTSILILLGLFIVPIYGWGMGSVRIWHITLIVMSPLFVLGGAFLVKQLAKLASFVVSKFKQIELSSNIFDYVKYNVILIVIPYFLFNSGIFFELCGITQTATIDIPYSIALSNYRTDVSTAFNYQDTNATDWAISHGDENSAYLTDYSGGKFFSHYVIQKRKVSIFAYYKPDDDIPIYFYRNYPHGPYYIMLYTWNTEKGKLVVGTQYGSRKYLEFNSIPGLVNMLAKGSLIYNNNKATIVLSNLLPDVQN
ncbi:MAG: DUF2206 domain-containing protein [Dehalococcoidia bacterium]|nr:DUF2206 domain-containing protein [Dehalococcoidia bacterium]MDD5493727.1 DUF2206 domain-containing protein [Dehalococcoidia bacterium]